MNTYTCENYRSVKAESMSEAAEVFSNRKARAAYGRRGYTRICNENSYSRDGSISEFNAFIGYKSGPNETTGHNVMFTVRRANK